MNIIIAGINGYLGFRTKKYFKNKGFNIYNFKKKIFPRNVDIIINMSGPPQDYCEKYPNKTRYMRSNLNRKLVRLAIKKKSKFFFYISTMHVYRDAKYLKEDSKTYSKNSYGTSHINGENEIIRASKDHKNINFKILRLTNCIGAPHKKNCNSWKLLVNDLCKQAIEKNIIKLNSTTNVQRDFISIEFFLSSMLQIINDNTKNLILNISSQKSISILSIAKKIQQRFYYLFKRKIRIKHSIRKMSSRRIVKSSINFKHKNNLIKPIDQTLIYAKKSFGN